jgi:HEPN domain-containing protein
VDSKEEAEYRLKIAGECLRKAGEEMRSFDQKHDKMYLARCVAESQLCTENSAKAVISVFRIPSREHDPSSELREVLEEAKGKASAKTLASLEELIHFSSKVAPEHIRATYGDEEKRILPSEIYDRGKAAEFLRDAEKSRAIAERFLREWFEAG